MAFVAVLLLVRQVLVKGLLLTKNGAVILMVMAAFLMHALLIVPQPERFFDILTFINAHLFLFVILNSYPREDIRKAYVELCVWGAGLALLFFGVGIVFGDDVRALLPAVESRYVQETWTVGLANFQQKFDVFNLTAWRAQLFFWEPAILGLYLVMALLLFLESAEKLTKKNWKVVSVLCFGVFSTYSTTSIIIMGAILAVYALPAFRKNVLAAAGLVLVLLFNVGIAYKNFEQKTDLSAIVGSDELIADTSYYKRTSDMRVSISAIAAHPLLGMGFGVSPYEEFTDPFLWGRGNTVGTLSLFAQFGLFGLFWLAPILFTRVRLFSVAVILIIYMNEPLTLTPMFLFLLSIFRKKHEGRRASEQPFKGAADSPGSQMA